MSHSAQDLWRNEVSRFEFVRKSMKFPNGGKAIAEQILVSEQIDPKEQDCESHSLGSEYES